MSLFTCFEHQTIHKTNLPARCFNWLISTAEQKNSLAFTAITQQGEIALKVRQYVGVIATPFGTQIEILPKITAFGRNHTKHSFSSKADLPNEAVSQNEAIQSSRQWLTRLLNTDYLQQAKIQQQLSKQSNSHNQPIHIWLIQHFLIQCNTIYANGTTSQYHQQENNDVYLRGKLRVAENIRENQLKMRQQRFAQTSDTRNHNSPENRLITHALYLLTHSTLLQSAGQPNKQHLPQNNNLTPSALKKQCQHLYSRMCEATGISIVHPKQLQHYQKKQWLLDFQHSHQRRLKTLYYEALSIAKLILTTTSHGAGLGNTQGVSLLFNMQSLFEMMVNQAVEKTLTQQETLKTQHRQHSVLSNDTGQPLFHLRPDIVIINTNTQQPKKIIDAKWKQLNHQQMNLNISQQDIYQMVTYATGYFKNQPSLVNKQQPNELWLVYPCCNTFYNPITYTLNTLNNTVLKIIPFDIAASKLYL